MIDATGSINLEDNHDLADVCIFSSCKGLGGLVPSDPFFGSAQAEPFFRPGHD